MTRWLVLLILGAAFAGCADSRTIDGMPMTAGIDVRGRWHECSSVVTFGEDGHATVEDYRNGCTGTGTYAVDGNVLEVVWDAPLCTRDASWMRELLRPSGGLVMVDPITAQTSRYSDDTAPRSRWRFSNGTQASVVRIVGTPNVGVGSGCYWSEDRACGGFFSCSGGVMSWTIEGTSLHASTSCSGMCPCGAVVDATASGDGFDATYHGASCEMPLSGAFTVTPLPEP